MKLSEESRNCERLRAAFEGREAIYVEKFILHIVRVTNIRCNLRAQLIAAEIEEIPTPGLELGPGPPLRRNRSSPRRWKIEAGYLTIFSDHYWGMGYGGWQLFFAPELVKDLASIASGWPTEVDQSEKCVQVHRFLDDRDAYGEQAIRVFGD